jgi:hypothetical protein
MKKKDYFRLADTIASTAITEAITEMAAGRGDWVVIGIVVIGFWVLAEVMA